MKGEERVCLRCNKKFILLKDGAGKKFCSKFCQVQHNRELARIRYYNTGKKRKRKKEEPVQQEQKTIETIAEVQRKAQAVGMSYGKYMLALQMGQIGG